MAYSRTSRRRPTRRRGRSAPVDQDTISGVLLWQVFFCGMLVALLYYGRQAENSVCQAANAVLQEQLSYSAVEVFAPAVEELEERFSFDYTDSFFAPFLPAKTDLPQGGQFFVQGDKKEKHLPPEGATLAPASISMAMYPPVGGRVTSFYGYREHPITEMLDFHTGIDVAAAMGTPIRAALPGTVEEVGESPIYGKYITLRHSENLITRYCHCSEILVEEGIVLRQGEAIAKVGSTGVSTGPHLHFEVLADDLLRNPLELLEGVREVKE